MNQRTFKELEILIITGSRGEWGYIRPLLQLIDNDDEVNYSICATNMHLMPELGLSVDEIEKDGFNIDYKIFMSFSGSNHFTHIKSLGTFLSSLADILSSKKFDFILLSGDRGEQLMGAIAGAYSYIPTGHIQAGEVSGNIDGSARHAIGKLAHMHFASNKDAFDRLIQLGEEPKRVFETGAPQLDDIYNKELINLELLNKLYKFDFTSPYIIVVQHSVTEEYDRVNEQINLTFDAIESCDFNSLVVLPNNDPGGLIIQNEIEKRKNNRIIICENLPRIHYLSFMKFAMCIVGNSSSALLEAPSLNLPAVNIGRRQNGRVQGQNVINVDFSKEDIVKGIKKAVSNEFLDTMKKGLTNPYGDGNSSDKIKKLIKLSKNIENLTIKNLTY